MTFSKALKASLVWMLFLIPGGVKAQETGIPGASTDFMTQMEDLEDLVRTGTAALLDIRSQFLALQELYEIVAEMDLRQEEGAFSDLPQNNGTLASSGEESQTLRARLIHEATPAQLERMWNSAYAAAIAYHNARQYSLAAQKLRGLLDSYPATLQGHAEATFYLGENLNAQGRYEEARKAYEKAAQSKSLALKQNATFRLMELDFQDKAYDALVRRYEAMKKASDRMALLAAETYVISGDFKKARRAMGKIGLDSPLSGRALLLEARYYQRKQGPKSALKFLTKIYDFVNDKDDVALAIGQLCYRLGRWQDAIYYYGIVSPSSPHYARAMLGIGWAQMDEGEHIESITTATQILSIGARNDLSFEGWSLIGHNYKLLGNYDQARQWFDRVLREERQNGSYLRYIQHKIRLEEMISELAFIRSAVSGGEHWARQEIDEVSEAVQRWVKYCEFELVDVAFLETTRKAQIDRDIETIDALLERSSRKSSGRR